MARTDHDLRWLARRHGIQWRYRDGTGRTRAASADAIRALLAAMGVDARVGSALSGRRRGVGRRRTGPALPPRVVTLEGGPVAARLRLATEASTGIVRGVVRLEDGTRRPVRARLSALRRLTGDGDSVVVALPVPGPLPAGYHTLSVRIGGRSASSTLVVAPPRCWPWPTAPTWGLFAPCQALRGTSTWGTGDLGALAELGAHAAALGADFVATLPLVATFPDDASPYRPVSQRFWNERLLDLRDVGPLDATLRRRLRPLVAEAARREADRGRVLDPVATTATKRRVLDVLATHGWGQAIDAGLAEWLAADPEVAAYARFRGVLERRGAPWRTWPARLRAGALRPGDADPIAERAHALAQWLAERQVARAAAAGPGLALDLPLGVHPDGYDAWRWPALFARGASVGAPPDAAFPDGQDWTMPPPRPDVLAGAGLAWWIGALRHHLRHADALRIDHVMGLHRRFWIPAGGAPEDGAYVAYPAPLLWAVLCLESWRHRVPIVGEDLGTVPDAVRQAMARHGVRRSWVLQLERAVDRDGRLRAPGPDAVASMNTHDLWPFAGWYAGDDVRWHAARLASQPPNSVDARDGVEGRGSGRARSARGPGAGLPPLRRTREARPLVAAKGRAAARAAAVAALRRALAREGHAPAGARATALHAAAVAWLAASPAGHVQVALADLAGARRPHNIPGNVAEDSSWRGRHRAPVAALLGRRAVRAALRRLAAGRQAAGLSP